MSFDLTLRGKTYTGCTVKHRSIDPDRVVGSITVSDGNLKKCFDLNASLLAEGATNSSIAQSKGLTNQECLDLIKEILFEAGKAKIAVENQEYEDES